MNRIGLRLLLACSLLVIYRATLAATLTIDFEELPLETEDFYNGSNAEDPNETGFTSFSTHFNNLYTDINEGCCWNGWAYSRTTDTTTTGPDNEYSAFAGSGSGGSEQYGVAFNGFDAGGGIISKITLPIGAEPTSVKITNTTYAALSMLNGDGFAKKFGGLSGDDPDWFLLRVDGLNAVDAVVGEVELYLADYQFADPNDDYILDQWTSLDLSPLSGLGVRKLTFRLTSTDNDLVLGMNTPAYVAIDDLVLEVPLTPGDFDLNGTVDGPDLSIWEQHYGTAVGAGVTTGDADEDGDVDGRDFLLWQANRSSTSATVGAIPEPSTALLLLCCSLLICSSRNAFLDDTLE